jgi:hypothetical protein
LCALGVLAVPSAASAAPRAVCTIDDSKLPEVSGLSATPAGIVAVTRKPTALRLYRLDAACKLTRIVNDANITPVSIQDLARTPDGALWVADIGDLERERATIAVYKVAPGASKATRTRLKYPDGKHDAAAMVMQAGGIPLIMTREVSGVAKLYTTAAPLVPGATATLQPAGTLTLKKSGTPGGRYGPVSQVLVSGAALSPDGKKLVVRTYTDAYEWDVKGNLAETLKSGKPRATPLPNEGNGESITYTSEGAAFVTASMSQPSPMIEWSPAPLPAPSVAAKAASGKAKANDSPFSFSKLSLNQVGGLVLGMGGVGLLMLIAGIVGIVRFRRTQAEEGEPSLDDRLAQARANNQGLHDVADETVAIPRVPDEHSAAATTVFAAEPISRGTVYGGSAPTERDAGRRATVYGGPPDGAGGGASASPPDPGAAGGRGTVYGGTTYGAGPASPPSRPGATYGGQGAGASHPPNTVYRGQPYSDQSSGAPYGGAAPATPYSVSPATRGPASSTPAPGGAPAYGGGGTVYGGRPPAEPTRDSRATPEPLPELPQRAARDWRSRRPPE